jgi:FkbM family methyltransferase
MKEQFLHLLFIFNVKVALRQTSFSKAIRKDIYKAFMHCTSLIKKNNSNEISCRIGAYSFKAPDPKVLQLLLREILINEQYRIELTTDAPRIIDCGSNLGLSILYFKLKFPKARIIAVEANPETFVWLKENVRQFEGVTLYNNFVSSVSDTSIAFFAMGAGDATASFDQSRGSVRHEIKTISLNSLVNDEKVDLMKIDIEGGEFLLFNKTTDASYLKHVKNILMEYHHLIDNKMGNSFGEFLTVFEKNNFIYNIETDKNNNPTPYFQDIFIKMKQL